MSSKTFAFIFGGLFVVLGVLGFIPSFSSQERLLGILEVNRLQNVLHILTGALGIIVGVSSLYYAKMYFKVFGAAFLIIAVLGFVTGDGLGGGMLPVNMADDLLCVIIAAVALFVGFIMKEPAGFY